MAKSTWTTYILTAVIDWLQKYSHCVLGALKYKMLKYNIKV